MDFIGIMLYGDDYFWNRYNGKDNYGGWRLEMDEFFYRTVEDTDRDTHDSDEVTAFPGIPVVLARNNE